MNTRSNTVGRRILLYIGRFFIWFFITLFLLLIGLYLLLYLVIKGPSSYVGELFVVSAMESSAGPIAVRLYLSDEEIREIQMRNSTQDFNEVTDTSLVTVKTKDAGTEAGEPAAAEGGQSADSSMTPSYDPADPDGDGIEIHEVHGQMYNGVMMVVRDPSRVRVAVIDNFSSGGNGLTLEDLIAKYDAVAGVNGGSYLDEAGLGKGGMPEGIVIADGQLLHGDPGGTYAVYGFTYDNVLVVGNMTANHALAMGVRDAVSFTPALIVNGTAANFKGIGSGLNPRTAIGQRADGAVLLLVIKGRQSDSMGASMADLIEVMLEYEAVNAANLDGGMSSAMIYNGEKLVNNCTIRDSRRMPTAFIVE